MEMFGDMYCVICSSYSWNTDMKFTFIDVCTYCSVHSSSVERQKGLDSYHFVKALSILTRPHLKLPHYVSFLLIILFLTSSTAFFLFLLTLSMIFSLSHLYCFTYIYLHFFYNYFSFSLSLSLSLTKTHSHMQTCAFSLPLFLPFSPFILWFYLDSACVSITLHSVNYILIITAKWSILKSTLRTVQYRVQTKRKGTKSFWHD